MDFLMAHHLGYRTFTIGGKLQPLSIRDQMVRAWMFVDRAIRQGVIKQEIIDPPFVVVGAGVAGVAAAARAAMQGINTIIIEKASRPLITQARCGTRWLCPTQYDWPHSAFVEGTYPFPVVTPKPPLSWTSDSAESLATRWHADFNAVYKDYPGLIQHMWDTELLIEPAPFKEDKNKVFIRVKEANAPEETVVASQAVLFAFGFGEERVFIERSDRTAGPSRGIPYWKTDPYSKDSCGLPGEARVLISGAGDGAIQDFLRITTKCPPSGEFYARRLYQECDFPASIAERLAFIEDNSIRTNSWGRSNDDDHGPLLAVHRAYENVIEEIFGSTSTVGPFRQRLRDALRSKLPKIKWVYQCNHFANCYGLNRFLTLLIVRFLKERGMDVLQPGCRVRSIAGSSGHVCQGIAYSENNADQAACHGCDHDIEICRYVDCRVPEQRGWGERLRHNFFPNVLILRNGVRRSELQRKLSPPLPRQILPLTPPLN